MELDGTSAGVNADGLTLTAGGSTVNAMVINRFTRNGIGLTTIGGNTITGCLIGINSAGDTDQGNGQNGIGIQSSNGTINTIGGTTPAARNVVSGNDSDGIAMQGSAVTKTVVQGKFIGTDITGTQAIGNSFIGVEIDADASDNTIGGTVAGAGNVISGNDLHGVNIQSGGTGCDLNVVAGNFIGTDASGTLSLPNIGDGVSLIGVVFNNTIGGTVAGAGNIIAFNQRNGVNVVPQSVSPGGNAIWGNSIFSNTQLGIDLNDDGVTGNDTGDGDVGPNDLQNFPDLTSVTLDSCSTTVQGTLKSLANTSFRVEFFSNASCDSSGNGEGQTFVGSVNVTTDGSGNATFNLPISGGGVTPGQVITATATNLTLNNTSTSNSACFTVLPPLAPGTAIQFPPFR